MKGHGGKRPGSGRKPKPPPVSAAVKGDDAEAFLRSLMADGEVDLRLRLDAAKSLLKASGGGKKDARQRAAKTAGAGRFAPTPPPVSRKLN